MNKLVNNYPINIAIKTVCLAAVVAMVLIQFMVYNASLLNVVIFCLYFFFYLQLPGLSVLYLLKLEYGRLSTRIVSGFFVGWVLIIAEYFLSVLINSDILLYAIGPILSLVFIAGICRDKTKMHSNALISAEHPGYRFNPLKLSSAFFVFAVLVLLYALLNTQYTYQLPEKSSYISMNLDMSYHMGLINSLSHDYPLMSMWVDNREIQYHIFSEILYAVPVRLFGITADSLLMSCGPYLTTYLISLSLYSFYREFVSKRQFAGLFCLMTVLANMYITKSLFSSWYMFHVFSNTNNFGFGISASLVTLISGKYYISSIKDNKHSLRHLFLLSALLMLTTGIKGPVGVALIGAAWGTLILGLILRRISVKSILPILVLSAGFLLVYITILGMKGGNNATGTSLIAFGTAVDIAFFKGTLVSCLKALAIPKILRLGIVFIVFMVFLLTVFVIPFIIGYIREFFLIVTKKKEFNFIRISVYAAALIGLLGLFLLNYSGHSQVYFGFVTVTFAPIITIWLLEEVGHKKSFWIKALKLIIAISLILTSAILFTYYKNSIEDAVAYADNTAEYSLYKSMSREEYDAMRWISENTPEDSLLATDRYYSVPLEEYSYQDRWDNTFFLYPDYSNRFCYLSGSGYNLPGDGWKIRKEMIEINNEMYDPSNEERGEIANELGIDYIVLSKRFTTVPSLEGDGYKLCFSNNDVNIYAVE